MLTYSQEADAAYVYVAPSTGDGEVGYTVVCECTGVELNLDYSPGGRLLGIEILGARQTLAPHVLGYVSFIPGEECEKAFPPNSS